MGEYAGMEEFNSFHYEFDSKDRYHEDGREIYSDNSINNPTINNRNGVNKMENIKGEVRALRADEIECRVQQCTEKGVMILLYKDARCDMAILDETFTPFGWQRKHEVVNNKEFCTVSIKSDTGEWISKQDCGTESNTAKEKGETSDAFKRACFNWGIGRELYTKIFIFIKVETYKNNDRWEMKDRYAKFTVSKIETDNKAKKILHLEISDKLGKNVFTWDNNNPPVYETITDMPNEPTPPPTQSNTEYKCPKCETVFEPFSWKGKDYTAKDGYEIAKHKNNGIPLCKNCADKNKNT